MKRMLKTFLLWLLIAAVPVQAIAAMAGMSCGPAHASAAVSQAADHLLDQQEQHAHHAMSDSSTPGSQAHPVEADTSTEHHGKAPHAKCSACSAFCIGAVAPPSPIQTNLAPKGSGAKVTSNPPSITEFSPEGRKRPPRHLSA
jgi:hypothetical protein